jgi:hypothetical protein
LTCRNDFITFLLTMSLNILNPKSLERQLKILETEIGKLQLQIDELEKMKAACLTLLGTAPAPEPSEPKEAAPVKSTELTPRILDLLRQKETGMTADEIFDALKESGFSLKGKRPVASVYSTLEKHPELFTQKDGEQWVPSNIS